MSNGQKFIARNRAPRVQIEYDVELYGAQKKVQLPFVMGVFSDLSGKSEQPPIADRKFLEIDADNFDDRMRAVAPTARFSVPNTLTGEGNLSVDLTFNRMDDFSPEAIAENVDALRPLLEARRHLTNLATYMDGKAGAETLIEKLLAEPALLAAISGTGAPDADTDAALQSLRDALPQRDDTPEDGTDVASTLDALAARAPTDGGPDTAIDDALSTLSPPPVEPEAEDPQADALAALRETAVPDAEPQDTTADVLDTIARVEDTAEPVDTTDDVLAGIAPVADTTADDPTAGILGDLAADAPDDVDAGDATADILAGIEAAADTPSDDDTLDDILSGIDTAQAAQDADAGNDLDDILSGLDTVEEDAGDDGDRLDDILGGLEAPDAEAAGDDLSDVLASIDTTEGDAVQDDTALDDILGGLEAPGAEAESNDLNDILASIDTTEGDAVQDDTALDDILGGLEVPGAEAESNDLNDILASIDTTEGDAVQDDTALDDILGGLDAPDTAATAEDTSDGVDDILAGLDAVADDTAPSSDPLDDILGGLETPDTEDSGDDLSDILAGIDTAEGDPVQDDTALDDILGGLDASDTDATEEAGDGVDDILAGIDTVASDAERGGDPLDDILGGLETPDAEDAGDDLNDILAGIDTAEGDAPQDDDPLGDILGGLEASKPEDDASDGLDDILAGLDTPEPPQDPAADSDPLDDILSGLDAEDGIAGGDAGDDLDDILAGLEDGGDTGLDAAPSDPDGGAGTGQPAPQSPFGKILAERPARDSLHRPKFRMALFGDFTGRASRGLLEIGDALAARPPIALDVDTVEDLISGFATTLHLKIGKTGESVAVPLKELDDLHPDELYDNIDMFQEIAGLRQQLGTGSMADQTTARLKAWSEAHATPIKLPKRSASASVPANLKLSDFQALIGDTRGDLTPAGPADDLIARIVGPHVVKAPDAGAAEMTRAVDAALSSAMRLILHHPDFQAIEAQWRSLDMLARRIETDSDLEIVLYDVSAEELAADLAAQEDLGQSGLFRLVTDVLDPEEGAGGFSALFGLYTFEETPPHAELLARIGQVGAHVDAPFISAMSPGYLDTEKEDRHPLVAEAWDTLRSLPEAAYLALASPRFLLRLPYGAKSEPIYAFDFEEFTPQEGLSGMLWANPVVLVAILLAATHKKDGKAMDLGSLMSLGDLPFHYVTDRHGDQVALPCTERNLTSDAAQKTLGRAYMPVVWMKGRNEIRLGTFRSLGGDVICGPWEDEVPAPRPRQGQAGTTVEMDIAAGDGQDGADPAGDATDSADLGLDDLLSGDDNSNDDDASLDDLLAGFGDDNDEEDVDDDDMDPELAALLEGL